MATEGVDIPLCIWLMTIYDLYVTGESKKRKDGKKMTKLAFYICFPISYLQASANDAE